MKSLSSYVRFPQMTFLLTAVIVFCIHCDYRGTLVDPNEPLEPLFILRGCISEEISDDYFGQSKSARIGLYPIERGDVPDIIYDNPDAYESPMLTMQRMLNSWSGETDTSIIIEDDEQLYLEFPSVSFSAEFPMNFISEFQSLPMEKTAPRFMAPSGKLYRVGFYAIALFDDVDKDGLIRFRDEIDSSSYEPQGGLGNHPPMIHAPGSDHWIGISRDYFIIYIEDAAFLDELNSHIAEHVGAHACWKGLTVGFNLVAHTSEVKRGMWDFTGVQAYPESTEVHIDQFELDMLFTNSKTPLTLMANAWLFYFQRYCLDMDNGAIGVLAAPGTDTLYLKSSGNPFSVSISEDVSRTPDDRMLEIRLNAYGFFDYGYYICLNPYGVSEMAKFHNGRCFLVNGVSCADSIRQTEMCDTISIDGAIDGDTLSVELAKEQSFECMAPTAPIHLDTLLIYIQKPSGSPITIIPVE